MTLSYPRMAFTFGIEIFATVCFALSLIHTFSVKFMQRMAGHYPHGSVLENLFHLLGEIEVVFGLWGGIFLLGVSLGLGSREAVDYLETRNFTEPAFVFVVLVICSTRPVLYFTERLIELFSHLLPLKKPLAFFLVTLILGPLLGSLITEPAAMTVTALILLDRFYAHPISNGLKYTVIGTLFVNVSIGGTLTPYAAPPVIMVASGWGWDIAHMLAHFGWKALTAIVISTLIVALRYRKEIEKIPWDAIRPSRHRRGLAGVAIVHLLILAFIVVFAHSMVVFMGLFLFFLGFVSVTREYQDEIKLREGLLVAFFLAGLVVIGGPQRWWLEIVLSKLDSFALFLGASALTAVTDNAALTYLGSQVSTLSEHSRYALVAGAVVGGGLTVIANAPNPAGYRILNNSFGEDGLSPILLFTHALIPTLVAGACFWLL